VLIDPVKKEVTLLRNEFTLDPDIISDEAKPGHDESSSKGGEMELTHRLFASIDLEDGVLLLASARSSQT